MKKNKILVLTSRNPYPQIDGGDKLRVHNLSREFSTKFDVTLVALTRKNYFNVDSFTYPSFYKDVKIYQISFLNSIINFFLHFFLKRNVPLISSIYFSSNIKKQISHYINDYDYVFVHLSKMFYYVDSDTKSKIIFDMCDLESMKIDTILKNKKFGLKSIFFYLSRNRTLNFENNLPHYFNYITLTSNFEVNHLVNKYIDRKVLLLMNGIDRRNSFQNFHQRKLLFIGNMNTLANLDAFNYFYYNIFLNSEIEKKFTLKVAGKMSQSFIKKYSNVSNVTLVPDFEDITNLFIDVFAGIAPIRIGSGLQNKVLEYMAHGIPCIATNLASSAFNVRPNLDILIAEHANDWIFNINKLLFEETYKMISNNGINYCVSSHNWNKSVTNFLANIE